MIAESGWCHVAYLHARPEHAAGTWRAHAGRMISVRCSRFVPLLTLVATLPLAAQSLPQGFSVAAPTPVFVNDVNQFGQYVSMVVDANGDPALAFLFLDPNSTGNLSENTVYFVRWDRGSAQWRAPVAIDRAGNINRNGSIRALSLAWDANTNTFGIAYTKADREIWLATSSDGGFNWSTQAATARDANSVAGPSLGMARGRFFLSYFHEFDGLRYVSGGETAAPASWLRQPIPALPNARQVRIEGSSLALDSSGNPGIAYFLTDNSGNGNTIAFWKPGSAPVRVTDTNGIGNDSVDAQLRFDGMNPRIAFTAARDQLFFSATHQVWVSFSNDGGSTWPAPVPLPNDGNANMGGIVALASAPGQAAVVSERTGGNQGGEQCGQPKLSRSTDLINWTTCSPGGPSGPQIDASFPAAAFAPDGSLYVAFQNLDATGIGTGVVVWHGPAQSTGGVPRISAGGVVNAAGFQSSVAPGSIFSIFGTNLARTTAGAASVPLPSNISGTQVFVNGGLVPLFFVSPGQINAQMPYEVSPGQMTVVVRTGAGDSAAATATVNAVAPGLFQFGNNRAIVQNPDGNLNDSSHPANNGDFVIAYLTGQGRVDNFVPTGQVAPSAPLSRPLQMVDATVGGQPAEVFFAGLTPGLIGVLQVNLRVPNLRSGDYPLVVRVGQTPSNTALVSVRGF